jgi:class 3 adenylate cyclase/predicted ATPase
MKLFISAIEDDHLSFAQSHLPDEMREKISSLSIEGERKNVTVLFSDISGFTALSERLDPEELTELINRCFDSLIKVIYKYEGTIDKFIGDCIMAIFGAPIAHEDDAERSVFTAFEILGALDRFNEEQGVNLSMHIGINSGVVIAGGVGSDLRMDYTVMGDTVNVAERLMSTAQDEILVSESVFAKTKHVFEMHKIEPLTLKGKAKKINAYRVIGIKEKADRKRGMQESLTPFVGREKELQQLGSIFKKVQKGSAAAVALIGEAGVGKSRLIEEFRKQGEGKAQWLIGRCRYLGRTLPFQAFRDHLHSYFDISEYEHLMDTRRKIKTKAHSLFKRKTNHYLPYFYLFLSLDIPESISDKVKYLDPEHLQLEQFITVKALFRELSKQRPLILCIEDMYWIDHESLELIKFLAEGLKDMPVLFLLETRPKEESMLAKVKGEIKTAFRERYVEMRLKPFTSKEGLSMVKSFIGISGYRDSICNTIFEKSEGNPFYIEEIIHSLMDAELLKKKNGMWQLTKKTASFEVPDSVEAVIRSRIDRLSDNEKKLLSQASVIGKSFPHPILQRLNADEQIDGALRTLIGREFIIRRNVAAHGESQEGIHGWNGSAVQYHSDVEYMFKHVLIRDVAYQGLLKKKRKKIHREVAKSIEEIFRKRAPEYYESLAFHYYQGDVFEKSYHYYKKAGNTAKELYRNSTAIECYSKAMKIHKRLFPDNDEEKAELLANIGDVDAIRGDYDNALEKYNSAVRRYTAVEKRADIKRKIANMFFNKSEYNRAIASYGEAIAMLQEKTFSSILSEILIDFAWLLSMRKGDHAHAKEMTTKALTNLVKDKQPIIYAKGINTLGGICYNMSNYDEALKYYQETLHVYETLNNKRGIGHASNNLGLIYRNKGEFNIALAYNARYLSVSEEIGDRKGLGIACNNRGGLYHDKGELNTALKYYRRYLTIAEEIGYKRGVCIAYGNIGIVYRKKGKLAKALEYYERCLAISEEIGYRQGICLASNYIGIAYFYKGEYDIALRHLRRYLSISEGIDYKSGIADACFNIGRIYGELGKHKSAEKYLMRAKEVFTETGGNCGKVFATLSELKIVEGNYQAAIELAKKALSLSEGGEKTPKESFTLRVLGKALAHGNTAEALRYLRKAVTLAKREKRDHELGISLYELGEVLADTGKLKEAKRHLTEARALFKKLGLPVWRKKVTKALGDLSALQKSINK